MTLVWLGRGLQQRAGGFSYPGQRSRMRSLSLTAEFVIRNRFHPSFGLWAALIVVTSCCASARAQETLVFQPAADGPGKGKHVVLLAGDEEYRSEEALPMLAKI